MRVSRFSLLWSMLRHLNHRASWDTLPWFEKAIKLHDELLSITVHMSPVRKAVYMQQPIVRELTLQAGI